MVYDLSNNYKLVVLLYPSLTWSIKMTNIVTKNNRFRFGFSPLLVIFMTIFIDLTGFGMILPLLPFYAAKFQAGSSALGMLVASFALMQFISSPILGKISDDAGRKPVLLLSILTSIASFIIFAVANSFIILLLSRIIAGIATEVGVAQAYIADVTSEKERAKGIGRVGAAQGAGFIVGPVIGGFLSSYGFWAAGYAAAVLALVNFVFVFFFLPETNVNKGLHISSSSKESIPTRIVNALSKPLIGTILAILFIMSLAFSAIPVIMPILGITLFGLKPDAMAFFFVYIGFVQILFQGFAVGELAKRLGEEKMLVFGSLLMTISLFLMAFVPNITVFLALTTIMVIGGGIVGTAVPSFISKKNPANEQGSMLGVTQSVSSIARVPGPLIAGFVSDFAGITAPFFVSSFLLLVASILGIRVYIKTKSPNLQQNI